MSGSPLMGSATGPIDPARLTQAILALAGAELPRVEFFRQLSETLAGVVRSGAVDLWVVDHQAWLSFRWTREEGFCASRLAMDRNSRLEDLCEAAGLVAEGWDHEVLTVRPAAEPEGASVTVLPLMAGEETAGWLAFPSPEPAYLIRREAEAFLRASETLAIALEHQRLLAALRERVKELTSTYGLSRLAHGSEPLGTLLVKAAELIPPALQFPEVAVASIVLDGEVHGTVADRATLQLRKPLVVNGVERGWVEMAYTEDRPRVGNEVFMAEEQELLATVARQLAGLIDRRQAQEERERLEAQLRHADRLATIGTLAAGVAHELNEPLGAVLGFAQLASGCQGLPAAAGGDLAKIEEAALHAREIVRQLMLFARREPPQTQPTELSTVVRAALSLVTVRCRDAGVEVVEEGPNSPLVVEADPPRLQQVVVNLLVNGVQAMPTGGTLTVRTSAANGDVILQIQDTGVGMDERVRERIFVPFFTTKEVNEGTGLGLAVVHGIVTAHGGNISVESTQGQGTLFEVRLPRAESTHPTAQPKAGE
ncbi:MAG: hypothetical protein K8R59_06060 [Thermoanaerobaculales bacterium]|nr:hypothetical protein [Thermoanaerobaculales bacterium]